MTEPFTIDRDGGRTCPRCTLPSVFEERLPMPDGRVMTFDACYATRPLRLLGGDVVAQERCGWTSPLRFTEGAA